MTEFSAWHDFFVMVGGGAAALTGLVFVAMTLHLQDIVHDPVHRHRARTILTGLTAVFIRCGLVLMAAQPRQAIAVELFAIAWIRNRFFDVSMRSSLLVVTVGGAIVLAIGVGIGSS